MMTSEPSEEEDLGRYADDVLPRNNDEYEEEF